MYSTGDWIEPLASIIHLYFTICLLLLVLIFLGEQIFSYLKIKYEERIFNKAMEYIDD